MNPQPNPNAKDANILTAKAAMRFKVPVTHQLFVVTVRGDLANYQHTFYDN